MAVCLKLQSNFHGSLKQEDRQQTLNMTGMPNDEFADACGLILRVVLGKYRDMKRDKDVRERCLRQAILNSQILKVLKFMNMKIKRG